MPGISVADIGETPCPRVLNIEPMRVIDGFWPEGDAGHGLDVTEGGHDVVDVVGGEIGAGDDVRNFVIGPVIKLFRHDQFCALGATIIGRLGVIRIGHIRGPGPF